MHKALGYGLLKALAVLTALLLLLAAVATAGAEDLDNGVVKLQVKTYDGIERVGSGFLVRLDADHAYILTAAHVVEGAKETGVIFKARPLDPVAGNVLGPEHWDRRGLALIVIPAAAARAANASALPLSLGGPPGTEIELLLIGHPRTVGDWSSLYGRVAAREGKALKVQVDVDEGNSGGPALLEGQVVGVVVEGLAPIAVIVPVAIIRAYLEGYNVEPGVSAQRPPEPEPAAQTPTTPAMQTGLWATLQPLGPKPGENFRDCPTCPEMVTIPAGSFQMGSPTGEEGRTDDEGPVRTVRIARPFALGRHEVTVGEFGAFVEATGYRTEAEKSQGCVVWNGTERGYDTDRTWRTPGFAQADDHPVVCVSWNDAREYLKWLGGKAQRPYRLPSEAEWEYAARAGTTTARFWGERADQACAFANVADNAAKRHYSDWKIHDCDDGYVHTAPVGSFKPNEFGLLDILGNVWEWTEDCWNDSYKGAPSDGSAWAKGNCDRRMLRGGSWFNKPDVSWFSWFNKPDVVRSANRSRNVTGFRGYDLGFRPARTF